MQLVFHHLGVACRNVATELAAYAALGYQQEGALFEDSAQGISGVFVSGPGPRLELLTQLGEARELSPWLARGVKMSHIAFEVTDLDAAVSNFRELGNRVSRPPLPAVAFEGRRVCFVTLRNLALIELIEARAATSG